MHRWGWHTFDRVIGYTYADQPGWRSVAFNGSANLDLEGLQRNKRKEVVLSESESDELMDAIFGNAPPAFRARCYSPHHIFIFFSKNRPVGAFEICFQCSQSKTWPDRNYKVGESYAKLMAICEKLGLGIKPPIR